MYTLHTKNSTPHPNNSIISKLNPVPPKISTLNYPPLKKITPPPKRISPSKTSTISESEDFRNIGRVKNVNTNTHYIPFVE